MAALHDQLTPVRARDETGDADRQSLTHGRQEVRVDTFLSYGVAAVEANDPDVRAEPPAVLVL
jgi:hypothetical protein